MKSQDFRTELKKVFSGRMFWIALIIGVICAFFSWLYIYSRYRESLETLKWMEQFHEVLNPEIPANTVYNSWIGGESFSLGYSIFFFVLPMLAVFPFGWSCLEESRSGYRNQMLIRTSRKRYYISKYMAVFVSGGIVIAVPLLFNLLLTFATVPAVVPDCIYPYYSIFQPSMWSGLFYTYPVVFCILYVLLDFLYAGLYAVLGMAIGFVIRIKAAVILFPFLLVMAIHYIGTHIATEIEVSPMYYLHAMPLAREISAVLVFGVWLILMILTVCFCVLRRIKNDIL